MPRPDLLPPADAIVTRTCSLWRAGAICVGVFHDGAEVEAADARENLAAIGTLMGSERAPVMVDLRGCRAQSPEARAIFAGTEAERVSTAVALVIGDPVSRVIGNFFLGFNRPITPSRLFTDVAAARHWLESLR